MCTLFFRAVEGSRNFAYRLDGRVPRKITPAPILVLAGCSPDGQWVAALPDHGGERRNIKMIYPARGDSLPFVLCQSCTLVWSRDGKFLYLTLSASGGNVKASTHAIKLRPGTAFPTVPLGGITAENVTSLPVAKVYQRGHHFYAGVELSTYAGYQETTQRNIYRIPLE